MDNNHTQTQTQLGALRTLQQSYDALADAIASAATSAEVEEAKGEILDAISDLADRIPNIEPIPDSEILNL